MIDSQELFDSFREDIVDTAKPYLWTEDEVTRYADAAYRMFVRLTIGIADFTSEAASVPIVAGEETAELHPSILRVMSAYRASDGVEVIVANLTDATFMRSTDYNIVRQLYMDRRPGPVNYMVIGAQADLVKWVQIPVVDDTVNMNIYRLPLTNITDGSHTLSEVKAEHHIHLLSWMKYLAYRKQDSETFNKTRSDEAKLDFEAYCAFCKAEWERFKHKTRVVQYGGL